MKVIPFPGRDGVRLGVEIDAALNGELAGPDADALRELGEDVRALAAAPEAEFERELEARVGEWARAAREPRRPAKEQLARAGRRIATSPRQLAAGAAGVTALLALLIVLFAGLSRSGGGGAHDLSATERLGPAAPRTAHEHSALVPFYQAAPAASAPSAPSAPQSATARRQQLGASVTLATSPEAVQEAADAVTRLGAGYGGYVASSHVQVRTGGSSEAQLVLSLPSAKLGQAIAALGRIAPERAVNQESQDIMSTYESARRRLSDDEAVRRALLRALAAATTQGEIESLRDRLAGNRGTLVHDREALHAVSHRASTAQLEVTIAGSSSGHALTVGRGLHDAGDVLATAGAVALIALAVLVPLALLALAGAALTRAWRRQRRESALEP